MTLARQMNTSIPLMQTDRISIALVRLLSLGSRLLRLLLGVLLLLVLVHLQ